MDVACVAHTNDVLGEVPRWHALENALYWIDALKPAIYRFDPYAATLKSGNNFNVLFRFIITPLFMFSGVFFPIDRLAVPVQWIAQASPLYHGVALERALMLGEVGVGVLWHVAYLVAMGLLGVLGTARRLEGLLLS